MTSAAPGERTGPLTRDLVVDAALRLVEEQGSESLTMRRLAEDLGTAVTAIYWHVGNRDTLLDLLVDRLLDDMVAVHADGDAPLDRIASLARQLRAQLLARPHLIALAHQRHKTAAMFQPVQAALARELAALGLRGRAAAPVVRVLQFHVVASVVLQRTASRGPGDEVTDPTAWPDTPDDPELVAALSGSPDYDAAFEYGLQALLATLSANGGISS
jgi:TetR/AcrR family tetracycline transcriptional repressor